MKEKPDQDLILKKIEEDLIDDLDKLDLSNLKDAAIKAAKEGGADPEEMEKEAAAIVADDDPSGVLASLTVEHANLMLRFKMSGWKIEQLRARAREIGFSNEKIVGTEAAGEADPESSAMDYLLKLILDWEAVSSHAICRCSRSLENFF